MSEPKWIEFIEVPVPATHVTKKYSVRNKETKDFLGVIAWYGPFRQYSFYPASHLVFEKTCLKDITSFLEKLMLERKIAKQSQQA